MKPPYTSFLSTPLILSFCFFISEGIPLAAASNSTKMSGQFLGDGNDDVHIDKRPCRNPAPTTKLLNENNLQQAALPFQQKSINDYRAAREFQGTATSNLENSDTTLHATLPTSSQVQDATSFSAPSDHAKDKRHIFEVDTSDDGDSTPDSEAKPVDRPQKKKGT